MAKKCKRNEKWHEGLKQCIPDDSKIYGLELDEENQAFEGMLPKGVEILSHMASDGDDDWIPSYLKDWNIPGVTISEIKFGNHHSFIVHTGKMSKRKAKEIALDLNAED